MRSEDYQQAVELFVSYSHEDEKLRDELAKHLKLLERQGLLHAWHDRQITAGQEWAHQIDEHVRKADVILLLISPDFLASDYCFDIEAKVALGRHEKGEATVIPVILRPVSWQSSPFAKLQALPRNGKPVTTFDNRDLAFEEIESGIRRAIENRSLNAGIVPSPIVGPVRRQISLLPITKDSPLLLGVAVDISGSMQTAVTPNENRLQGVLSALKRIARQSSEGGVGSGIDSLLKTVRIFAYGFGFSDRSADFGPLAGLASQFLGLSLPSAPSKTYRGAVRDLLEMSGLGTDSVPLETLGSQWQQVETRLWEQRFDLFGETPMKAAMNELLARFRREFERYQGVPRSVLILISDGDSTDGSPVEACRQISELGTTIVGAYLTATDVTQPRKLYIRPGDGWPSGARTLFEMASPVGEDGLAIGLLKSKGWDAEAGSRLFIQLNQSEIISEFVNSVIEMEHQLSSAQPKTQGASH